MKVYLLYAGNAWLDRESLQLIAVCTTKGKAVKLAQEDAQENGEALTEEDVFGLELENQTRCRDENYLICKTETDVLED